MRSAIAATSPRSWVMNNMLSLNSTCRSRRSETMTACTDTSSADVISSQIITSGCVASARAIATRWLRRRKVQPDSGRRSTGRRTRLRSRSTSARASRRDRPRSLRAGRAIVAPIVQAGLGFAATEPGRQLDGAALDAVRALQRQRLAEEEDAPAGDRVESRDRSRDRGLATARLPDEGHAFSCGDREADVVRGDRLLAPRPVLGDQVLHDQQRRRVGPAGGGRRDGGDGERLRALPLETAHLAGRYRSARAREPPPRSGPRAARSAARRRSRGDGHRRRPRSRALAGARAAEDGRESRRSARAYTDGGESHDDVARPSSTMRPAYITAIRSAICATTERSCVT